MAISSDTARTTPTDPILLPWQGYSVPYEGTGDPPSDQWRKFRVRPGRVNNLPPDNLNEIFTAPTISGSDPAAEYSLEITLARGGGLTIIPTSVRVILGAAEGVTKDGEGVPAKISLTLGGVRALAEKKSIAFDAYRNTSFSVCCVQTASTCEKSEYYLLFGEG